MYIIPNAHVFNYVTFEVLFFFRKLVRTYKSSSILVANPMLNNYENTYKKKA